MINCPKCGALNEDTAAVCYHCQSPLSAQGGYQPQTGYQPQSSYTAQDSYQPIQPSYAAPPARSWQEMGADKKIAAGICGILLGGFGVHKFILGYQTEGLIMLLITVLTCGFAGFITGVIGLVEGIIYLTKSDEDFVRTYIQNRKGWF
jgi:TM2 domain-containing membrane protein YozV